MYEQPRNGDEMERWRQAGINLLCCHNADELDAADRGGMMGWVPVPVIVRDEKGAENLAGMVGSMKDSPAVVAWEAQDEAIWNACRLDDGRVTTRIREQPQVIRDTIQGRLEGVVSGFERGSRIVRGLDPGRKIWLNEACKSDQETLARCLPCLDVVGYDYYPIPENPGEGRQMQLLGGYTDRFRRTAPAKDLWVVEQAFSWSTIRPESGRPEAYPGVEEYRFMAWISISHGATGLLWWGSAHEKGSRPFMGDLMDAVSELDRAQPYLVSGDIPGVRAIPDERQNPELLGVSVVARRRGDGTLLALVNEDPFEHTINISGVDWAGPGDLHPLSEPSHDLVASPDGLLTRLGGREVRIYITG